MARAQVPVVLAQATTVENQKAEADRLLQQGVEQFHVSQFEAALQSWEKARQLYREVKDRSGEGQSLGSMGVAYDALGNYAKAIEYQQQSLAIAREIKDRLGEGQSLGNLGLAYQSIGNYAKAIEYHQQSLAIKRSINDRLGEGHSLGNLGNAYQSLGNYAKAIEYQQQSLTIKRAIKDRLGEGRALGNLGNAYYSLGNYPKAIAYHQQSLAIARELQNRQGEGNALGNLGNADYALGNYAKAIAYHQQNLAIAQELKDRLGEGNALSNLGNADYALGNYVEAIENYQQSLAIARELKDRNGEGRALGNLGNAYQSLGNYAKAIESHQQSLAIAREINDRDGEKNALGNLGNVYRALGNNAKAIEHYQQTLAIAREIKDRLGEGIVLNNLGATLFRSGNLAQSQSFLQSAIQVNESLRQGLSDSNKAAISDTQNNSYKLLQQVLIAQNQPEAALEIAERGRAQAFLEQIAKRLQSTAQPQIPPLKIDAIKQIAKAQNATLVEYSQVYDDQLYIWVINPTGEVNFRKVSIRDIDLTTLVTTTRTSLNVRNRNTSATNGPIPNESLQQLHQLLIAPIANLLPTAPNQRVIFLPQGSLFLVPFAALQDPQGNYLIQQHTIVTAPAIQVLELTRQQRQRIKQVAAPNTLIVGNPKMPPSLPALPGAQQEAEAIARLLKTPAIIGPNATKAAIVQQIPQARLIHLATHGLLDDQAGLDSAIVLAPDGSNDGFLTAAEILNLKLNADLVVLSACDTGRGKITGDGVIGLSRSLISAGAPSVIVSLWAIPDAPTASLMTHFYQNLPQQPDKAQALRQAMLTTMKQYPDPVDWAAFTLIGEAD